MFRFRLAARLGCSYRDLLQRLDSAELAEWEAYDKLEPLDTARRIELAVAINTAMLANINRSKTTDAYQPPDFMKVYGEEYREVVEAEAGDKGKTLADKIDRVCKILGV